MLISIIINCFNGEKYLREAIDSIYNQTYHDWEIIFWDNRSSDNSAVIAKSYDKKLKYFLSKEHTTLGRARNLALNCAKGDYVSFLDCDDVYLPEKISIQLAAMQNYNSVLSYGSWIKINENGDQLGIYKIPPFFGKSFERILSKYDVNFQTLMIKNNFLKENNIFFDNHIKFATDHNLVLKIAFKESILSLDSVLAKYRVHENSLSMMKKNDKYNDYNYTINFLEKMGAKDKFKNFSKLALIGKYKMFIYDSIEDKKYHKVIYYCIEFIYEYFNLAFRRVI
tara:strand:- start:7718 stop:8563 length:846 start_codon:yes stop_codon:yes gene_type:complete